MGFPSSMLINTHGIGDWWPQISFLNICWVTSNVTQTFNIVTVHVHSNTKCLMSFLGDNRKQNMDLVVQKLSPIIKKAVSVPDWQHNYIALFWKYINIYFESFAILTMCWQVAYSNVWWRVQDANCYLTRVFTSCRETQGGTEWLWSSDSPSQGHEDMWEAAWRHL